MNTVPASYQLDELLHQDGFELVQRHYTDGAFISLTRAGVRVSKLAAEALNRPPALYVLRKPDQIALVPAPVNDDRAYKLCPDGNIGSDGLRKRLLGDGWEHARYRAETRDGYLLIWKGRRI